uniref:Uncharacterized protein n=1 Tax=Zeugodacus cucurbitae TaxID=28588 RepID=A0A0A1X395_ZEUCU
MGSAESRPEEKPPSDMSARRKSACKSASDNGSDSSSCCCNDNQELDNGSRSETNNAPSCSLQPTCCPYPEFTLSTSGICYVQCKFCCQMYPCCCAECPNCGGRPGKTSKEVEIPDIAFCPCCGQESPKANGLQNFCKPTPCCMCIDTCAERELIAKCLLRSFRQARGERRKSCCECQPEQEEDNGKGTKDRDKSERFRYPAYKSAVPCTCESDEDAADSSQPEHVKDCCCERHKSSERPCEPNSCENYKRTQQRQSRCTRAQCCKAKRQRSVQCCACNSRGQRQNYGDYPSVAHCPCGCEVEIKNITYSLPVCRLDDEDDDNGCCCCNK